MSKPKQPKAKRVADVFAATPALGAFCRRRYRNRTIDQIQAWLGAKHPEAKRVADVFAATPATNENILKTLLALHVTCNVILGILSGQISEPAKRKPRNRKS